MIPFVILFSERKALYDVGIQHVTGKAFGAYRFHFIEVKGI